MAGMGGTGWHRSEAYQVQVRTLQVPGTSERASEPNPETDGACFLAPEADEAHPKSPCRGTEGAY